MVCAQAHRLAPRKQPAHRRNSRRHRRFRLHTHPSRQALWILILIACCIDDAKIKAKQMRIAFPPIAGNTRPVIDERSEEHTSELQSLMRISYAVFCLKKKKTDIYHTNITVAKDTQIQS